MFARDTAGFSLPRLLPICVLFIGMALPGTAQVAIDLWTADNGLPQNIVLAICQTPDGYLWLATFNGLVRFDGVRFVTYNRSNTPGIKGNRFGSLFCTADGDLWAGTEGSGVTHYHQGRFTTYTTQDGLLSDKVDGISADNQGNLWVLAHGYLNQWRPADRRFVSRIREEDKYTDSLTPDGRFGYWRIDETELQLFVNGMRSHHSLPAGWHHVAWERAGEDLNHHIWIAGGQGSLWEFIDGRWSSASHRRTAGSASGVEDALTTDYRDSHGKIWRCEIV
jgi:hypothetical protein